MISCVEPAAGVKLESMFRELVAAMFSPSFANARTKLLFVSESGSADPDLPRL